MRYAKIYNTCIHKDAENKPSVGHIFLVDTGNQITISGSGEIFDFFLTTGLLQKFAGFGKKPVTFFKPGFKTAPLRKMNLDKTYYNMHYDVRHSKL